MAALGAVLLVPATATGAGVKRPRPSDVPATETSIAPNDFQLFNNSVSSERTYSSRRAVVHFVVLGIDAPPLNDDDADSVPNYVERVGEAADRALAYYERRGFRPPLPGEASGDDGGPSPQTPSTSRSTETTRFASRRSSASAARRRVPPSARTRSPSRTSSGRGS